MKYDHASFHAQILRYRYCKYLTDVTCIVSTLYSFWIFIYKSNNNLHPPSFLSQFSLSISSISYDFMISNYIFKHFVRFLSCTYKDFQLYQSSNLLEGFHGKSAWAEFLSNISFSVNGPAIGTCFCRLPCCSSMLLFELEVGPGGWKFAPFWKPLSPTAALSALEWKKWISSPKTSVIRFLKSKSLTSWTSVKCPNLPQNLQIWNLNYDNASKSIDIFDEYSEF